MDAAVQEKVQQKANELTATYDEKLRNYEDRYALLFFIVVQHLTLLREQDLTRQVTLVKNQLRDLRASNENNQAKLMDHTQKQGE